MGLKKHILRISLLLIILLTGVLCITLLYSYSSNSNIQSTKNTGYHNLLSSESNPLGYISQKNIHQPLSGQFQPTDTSQEIALPHARRPNGMIGTANGSANYTPQIVAYALIFLLLFLAAYYLVTKKRIKIQPGDAKILILTLLGVGLLFNFFSLLGANFTEDAGTLFVFSYHSWGLIAIVMITAFSWFLFFKGNSGVYAAAVGLLLIDGVFTFSTRMHERYLFPAVALSLLTFIYLREKRLMFLAAGFSATIYINTHFVLIETLSGINSVSSGPILIGTSLVNVLLFVYLIKVLYEIVKERRKYDLLEHKL